LGGGYARIWQETNRLFARRSPEERDQMLGLTAAHAYRLDQVD
jgi:hypothetical protein